MPSAIRSRRTMQRFAATTFLLAASVHASSIPLDVCDGCYTDGPRLLITVSPQDVHGNDLPAQKLILDTGSATLAFCDNTGDALAHELANSKLAISHSTFLGLGKALGLVYSCNTYDGTGPGGRVGYWGPFYHGDLRISKDVHIKDADFSIMKQQVGMPCNKDVQGIFGIGFRGNNERFSEAPTSWKSSSVGECPFSSKTGTLMPPLMELLTFQSLATTVKQAVKDFWHGRIGTLYTPPRQIGIYWSGKAGAGQGQLYLNGDATNNPHYDATAAFKIGKASMGTDKYYDIGVDSLAIEHGGVLTSYPVRVDCSVIGNCIMDSGTPQIVVPKAAYDDMQNWGKGTFTVTLDGGFLNPLQNLGSWLPSSVKLEFDVKTLVDNDWIGAAQEDEIILGLPLRAFYYTVMDISDKSVSFSPMAAHHR